MNQQIHNRLLQLLQDFHSSQKALFTGRARPRDEEWIANAEKYMHAWVAIEAWVSDCFRMKEKIEPHLTLLQWPDSMWMREILDSMEWRTWPFGKNYNYWPASGPDKG